MKRLIVLASAIMLTVSLQAQTEEELKAQQAPKNAEIAKLQGEVDALQAQIDALPGWKKGIFGTIGGSITEQRNAFTQNIPDNSSGNIGATLNAFANLKQEKFFWNNTALVNLSWVRLDDRDDSTDSDNFEPTTDIFNISSLYGYRLSPSWAASALAEYRTTILNDFNDPGYLDIGIGFTWTPASIEGLTVVIHPANYNFVFSDSGSEFEE